MRLRVVKRRDEGAQQGDNMTEILQATRQICTLNHFEGCEATSARPRSLQAKRWTCLKGKVGKPGPGGSGGEGRGGKAESFCTGVWLSFVRPSLYVPRKFLGREGREYSACGPVWCWSDGLIIMARKGYLAGIFERIIREGDEIDWAEVANAVAATWGAGARAVSMQ